MPRLRSVQCRRGPFTRAIRPVAGHGEGRTPHRLARRSRLARPGLRRQVGVQLASGLAAVHAAGIIHRDVKPANVIITREPQNQVRLVDFGVAKLPGAVEFVENNLTQSGAILLLEAGPDYRAAERFTRRPS